MGQAGSPDQRYHPALRERFGLRIASHWAAVEIMIIGRVERPDEN